MGAKIDSRFLSVIVHDLRTPLNVITLSMRMIEQQAPPGNPDLVEDVSVVHSNVRQIDGMLSTLGDYYRLLEDRDSTVVFGFDPRRLVLEEAEYKQELTGVPIRVDIAPGLPAEVTLDEPRARMALRYALSNALAAAEGAPVIVSIGGGPGRWTTRVSVESAPPGTVESVELHPASFDRLIGNAPSRLGLELSVAALVSEQFGGSARLEVEEGRRSSILLDWPIQDAARL